jgi:hypothetical protein
MDRPFDSKRLRIDPELSLDQFLAERRYERERAAGVLLHEVGETEFTDETAGTVADIIGWLAGKTVEVSIHEVAEPVRRMRVQGDLFRLEDSPGGGWLIWVADAWVPLGAEVTVSRGSVRYRLGDQEWWGWCFSWVDRDMGWEVAIRDRSRAPVDVRERGLYLEDALPDCGAG